MDYLINNTANTCLTSAYGISLNLSKEWFYRSLLDTHNLIGKIMQDIPVDIFSILGMRNLSAFIGELYVVSLVNNANQLFRKNPHQDGYPDLLLMDNHGQQIWQQLADSNQLRDKMPFSPFANGGIEVKATCGSVPTPAQCAKKSILKPDIGDIRIEVLQGYDWKAHHRETNYLVGILWDFNQYRVPEIVAVFFGNNLVEDDWGKIIQPKEGGGRTTSVSIMTRSGVAKMYQNWLLVKNDDRYINFINHYNKGDLIKRKL